MLLLTGAVAFAAPAQSGAPLTVGGNFSSKVTNNQAVVFDQRAREAEIAALNARLKNKDFAGTVRRINDLTARNFLDQRFYLLLAIAYDGLHKYEDVIYSAGEAIAVAPQDPRPYIMRAQAYLRTGDYERSRIDVEKALRLNPQSQLALKVKKELDDKTQVKTPARPASAAAGVRQGGEQTPQWLILYFVVIVLAIAIFVYLRYEDVFRRGPKTAFNRKEVEVKEQYDFLRQIGEGGMGKVYEAYDRVLKRKVAIKRVRPELVFPFPKPNAFLIMYAAACIMPIRRTLFTAT